MFHKYFLPALASIALIASISIVASAQSAQLRGHVTMRQADGTVVPAAGAVVDVYRTDIATGKISTKTDKKGDFIYAALPYIGDYIVAFSMAGAQSSYLHGVNVKSERVYEMELTPGDGKPLTLADIKTAMAATPAAASSGAKESAEDKAKRAELIKKNAEIDASNKKIQAADEIIQRTFKAGNEAFNAKNYDLAIAQYEEGLAADPEHPAAAQLLANKTVALRRRAEDRYNAAIKSTDTAAKAAGFEAARNDWRQASETSTKVVALLRAKPAPSDATEATTVKDNMYRALQSRAEAMRMFVTKVDPSQADAGLIAYQEYMAVELEPARKAKVQFEAAQMLLDAGAGDKAFVEFQKVLASSPDNPDANLGAGLSLFSSGDKSKYAQAANYLQHFVDLVPDDNKDKADVKATLAYLKETENVVPDKTTPVRRTRKP